MTKYCITVKRVSYDGNITIVLSATGVNENTLAIILKGYNLPGYEITICEMIEKPEGSERACWLRGE